MQTGRVLSSPSCTVEFPLEDISLLDSASDFQHSICSHIPPITLVSGAVLPAAALRSEPQLSALRIPSCWMKFQCCPTGPGLCATEKETPDSCCYCLGIRHPEWWKGLFLPHNSFFTSKNPTSGKYRIIPTAIHSYRMRTTHQDSFWKTMALHTVPAAPFTAVPMHRLQYSTGARGVTLHCTAD